MYVQQSLNRRSFGFHYFIAIVKARSESIDLILPGMSSSILGAKNDNDPVPLCTDYTVPVKKLSLLLISLMEDVLKGKTSFIISGKMSLNILQNSIARHCNFLR